MILMIMIMIMMTTTKRMGAALVILYVHVLYRTQIMVCRGTMSKAKSATGPAAKSDFERKIDLPNFRGEKCSHVITS